MEIIITIAGVIIFVLVVLVLAIVLMNQINEMNQINIPKKRETRYYILEVNTKGEIKIKPKTVGGGFDYKQF